MKYAKFERDKEKIIEHFITKELEPFGKTYNDILNVENWFQIYTVTEEDYKAWKEYCIDYLRENYGMPKYRAVREMSWFGLQYGLKFK
jgi:hypothetical protein